MRLTNKNPSELNFYILSTDGMRKPCWPKSNWRIYENVSASMAYKSGLLWAHSRFLTATAEIYRLSNHI